MKEFCVLRESTWESWWKEKYSVVIGGALEVCFSPISNLIRLLCEAEDVDRFDAEEDEYPMAVELEVKGGSGR